MVDEDDDPAPGTAPIETDKEREARHEKRKKAEKDEPRRITHLKYKADGQGFLPDYKTHLWVVELDEDGAAAGPPTQIDQGPPPAVVAQGAHMLAVFNAGKQVAAQSGCLACHKIGENGNGGPGPELTDIGDKLLPGAILRTLENPTAPMPSFSGLPEEKKTALVAFLSSLRGQAEEGAGTSAQQGENGGSGG